MSRILVLDDDDIVLGMLLRWLSTAGYEVEGAGDGECGLRLLEIKPFDLIVTDIIMPEKEGLETIPEIRRRCKDLPIIAISGGGICGQDLYLEIALKLGADYVFQKPFEREPFLKAVRDCLSRDKPGTDEPGS